MTNECKDKIVAVMTIGVIEASDKVIGTQVYMTGLDDDEMPDKDSRILTFWMIAAAALKELSVASGFSYVECCEKLPSFHDIGHDEIPEE